MKANYFLAAIYLSVAFLAAGCGGGGGGGSSNVFALNGPAVTGTVSTSAAPAIYTFDVVADAAYTISTVTTEGNVWVTAYNGDPANRNLIGFSMNNLSTTPNNTISFIASFTGQVSVVILPSSSAATSSYTIQAFDGNLEIGGNRTASTYNSSIKFSFDAVSGTAYQVRLTPQTGNVNIGSVNAKLSASVGSSALSGTAMDSVTFLAPVSQRYYVQVSPTSVDTTFDIQVVTTSAAPDLSVVVDSATSDGTNVTVNYTVRNQGINAAGAFGVTGWSDNASVPTIGAVGLASASHTSLAGGASVSGSFIIADTANSGTAYVVVDTVNAVAETNEANNISAGNAWLKPQPAPQSFNFETGAIPAGMTMSGSADWLIDATTGGAASAFSLKAGTIMSNQTTCAAVSVTNSSSVSFDYAVSSEPGYDYLKFYIDGVQNNLWSGAVAWTSSGIITAGTTGVHEYKWCYTKDLSFSSGSDTAWIDNIVIN